MIRRAAEFAAKAHKGVLRKGGTIPYIYHPMEVALLVFQMGGDEEMIAAAYLHDVLEDTLVTAEEMRNLFGERVLSLVLSETEDKALSWHERKARTVQRLGQASRDVKIIAMADKLSNMRATARDYLAMGDLVWQRFHEKRRECHQWYAQGILEALSDMKEFPQYWEFKKFYELVFGA